MPLELPVTRAVLPVESHRLLLVLGCGGRPRRQPPNAWVGSPATPGSRRNSAPREGLVRQLGVAQALAPGRHVQVPQAGAAETAAGHLGDRQVDVAQQVALRRVASRPQPPCSATQTQPSASTVMPSGPRALHVHGRQRAATLDRPGRRVEVEDVDTPRGRVDEVEAVAGRAPAEPVGDGRAGDRPRDRQVRPDTVERPRRRPLVERHRARPEPALRVAGAVVEPVARHVRLDGQQRLDGAVLQHPEPVRQAEHHAAPRTRQREADQCGHGRHLVPAGGRVEPVDRPPQDVHPQQGRGGGVPARPFAELRRRGDRDLDLAGDRGTRERDAAGRRHRLSPPGPARRRPFGRPLAASGRSPRGSPARPAPAPRGSRTGCRGDSAA